MEVIGLIASSGAVATALMKTCVKIRGTYRSIRDFEAGFAEAILRVEVQSKLLELWIGELKDRGHANLPSNHSLIARVLALAEKEAGALDTLLSKYDFTTDSSTRQSTTRATPLLKMAPFVTRSWADTNNKTSGASKRERLKFAFQDEERQDSCNFTT